MSENRFDSIFRGKSEEFLLSHGLVEMTDDEAADEQLCMSMAVPLPLIWKNRDDNEKYVQWDSEMEKHLQHLGKLIDHGGRESFEPFNIYQEMGLNWLDGFAQNQGSIGTCCLLAHGHSGKQTYLTQAKLHGGMTPVELQPSITYSIARGGWGSGLNLAPMSKAAAKYGNYITSDVGKYSASGSAVTKANQQKFAANALKYQSIPCYVPDLSFDTFYELARAGCACNIGSSSWPSGSIIDANGMSIGQGASRGAHATCLGGFAIEINGIKYILWTNSHGARFKQGTRIRQNPYGCFMTRQNWNLLALNKRFGTPYINFIEMIT
jgi:hypothetical protein